MNLLFLVYCAIDLTSLIISRQFIIYSFKIESDLSIKSSLLYYAGKKNGLCDLYSGKMNFKVQNDLSLS